MKVAIMQPYFFPYIGYFSLINFVEKFVIYDSIEFSKKGWINRNRILLNNNKEDFITVPLKKDSDFLNVNQRYLADSFEKDKKKIIDKVYNSYHKTKYFKEVFLLFEKCLNYNDNNLFNFIYNSLKEILHYLKINTSIIVSSTLELNQENKNQSKVLEICEKTNATEYINPLGGLNLYNKNCFLEKGIKLSFMKMNDINYKQKEDTFIPNLSILDVMMFNDIESIHKMLNNFELI